MNLTITLTGTCPMLQHNGRLANPIDPHTRALKALTAKRTKTDDDLVEIMVTEARGGCWETPDGQLGLPTAAVWRSIYDAAKAFKLGEQIKRSLLFADPTHVDALIIDGDTHDCDVWLKDDNHIDYRPVKVKTSKVMRARPLIPTGWQSTHTFDLLDDVMDARDLIPVLERAGRLVGVGDWRPTYGRFAVDAA